MESAPGCLGATDAEHPGAARAQLRLEGAEERHLAGVAAAAGALQPDDDPAVVDGDELDVAAVGREHRAQLVEDGLDRAHALGVAADGRGLGTEYALEPAHERPGSETTISPCCSRAPEPVTFSASQASARSSSGPRGARQRRPCAERLHSRRDLAGSERAA